MPDQDDDLAPAPTNFVGGFKKGVSDVVTDAATGAKLAAKAVFGIAPAPGEDNDAYAANNTD